MSAIDPASALLSPPGGKTPSSGTAIHPFFTPRRALSAIGTANSRSGRAHLLSPDESPSHRASKRARIDPSIKNDPASPSRQRVELDLDEDLELVKPPQRVRPTTQNLLLKRSLGMLPPGVAGGRRGFHCADWAMEPLAFYSSPDDIHQIFPSDDGAQCLPFSTSACNASSLIAIGDESGAVRLVETAKDEDPGFAIPYLTFQCHDNAIFDLCWSPDDKLLATASGDQTCRIFDVMKQRTLSSLQHHQNSVKQIYFNAANPSILCSSSRDGNLNVWDLRVAGPMMSDGPNIVTVLSPVLSVLGAHKSNRKSNSVTAAVWLDDHRIATACEHNAVIKVWDLRTSQVRRKSPIPVETSALPPHHALPAHRNFGVNSLSVSPDGQRVYAVCKDSNVYAYATHHLQNGPMHAYSHPRLHAETFYVKGGISRDGKFVATGSSDGVACLFPTEERYLDKRISDTFVNNSHPLALAKYLQVGRGVALVRGHDREVTDVTWTVGGDLVTVSDNYTARCWRQGERGVEAENMRAGGEEGGRRWLWGWADRKGDAESGGKI